jgi:uncharacterized protein YkwD
MNAWKMNPKRLAKFVAVSAILLGAGALDAVRSVDAAPANAAEWLVNEEEQLLNLHNEYRATQGLPPLVRDPLLDIVARDWTARMTLTQTLEHRPNLRDMVQNQVTTDWHRLGENVGYGPTSNWLHDAFVASPGHEANITGSYNRVGIGAAYDSDGDLWVTVNFLEGPDLTIIPAPPVPPGAPADAWIVSAQGAVTSLGNARHYGDMGHVSLNKPIVTMAPTVSGDGYWLTASDGGIFTFGDAGYHGSTGRLVLNKPIVGMTPTPSGNGYWLVASDGGIFTFGDATYYGSTGNLQLNKPIVDMASTSSGNGYWLVASDGGIFTFGDATYYGSTGNLQLNKPIVDMASTSSGNGYWLVASDGGIFTFGDATFEGSAGGTPLSAAVRGISPTSPVGGDSDANPGYWIFTEAGLVLAYGAAGTGWVAQAPYGVTAVDAVIFG